MEDNPGNSLRKASVEERNGQRYGGKIVEIAVEMWEETDAAVEKYVGKSGRSAMEEKSWK